MPTLSFNVRSAFEVPGLQPGWDIALLVAQAKLGNSEAFTRLYREFAPRVYAFAARRMSDREAAEDVTQEVFTRAFASLSSCRDDSRFAGWLFAIARHVVGDQYRKRRVTGSPLDDLLDAPDPDQTPDQIAMARESARELSAMRDRCLSPHDRELLDLLMADLTHREISVALGKTEGAIRTAHWRLIKRLRDCLAVEALLEETPNAAK